MVNWDAAVVVLLRNDGKVLGVTRGRDLRDINLPGGYREMQDGIPQETARRELWEETGLNVDQLVHLATWRNEHGKRIVAFRGFDWFGKLRPSSEGYPVWVDPKRLSNRTCMHAAKNLLAMRIAAGLSEWDLAIS